MYDLNNFDHNDYLVAQQDVEWALLDVLYDLEYAGIDAELDNVWG